MICAGQRLGPGSNDSAFPPPLEEAVRLAETFQPGQTFHVTTKVQLSGTLTPPADPKAKAAPKPVKLEGTSAIAYDERILDSGTADNPAPRTLRIYRRVELERTVEDEVQESSLRPTVRRLVRPQMPDAALPVFGDDAG